MTYNPRQKALEATYFQGEYVYNFGGWVPSNIDQTPNPTPSFTPTNTPTPSNTPTNTPTPSNTPTNTPTRTTTPTNTPTSTSTPTNTPTPTSTKTPTPTPTPPCFCEENIIDVSSGSITSWNYLDCNGNLVNGSPLIAPITTTICACSGSVNVVSWSGSYSINFGSQCITPTPTPTNTSTPTRTPTLSVVYDLYDAENCCSPFDIITFGLVQGTTYNQDAGIEYNGNKYVIIGNGSGSAVVLSSTTIDNICSTFTCPTPSPTPTNTTTPTNTPTLTPSPTTPCYCEEHTISVSSGSITDWEYIDCNGNLVNGNPITAGNSELVCACMGSVNVISWSGSYSINIGLQCP